VPGPEIAEELGGHVERVSIGVDADDPARHLYARAGWEVTGPGLDDGRVILGRRRPTGT
jgi:hypothetical protein